MSDVILQFCGFDSAIGRLIAYATEGPVGHVDIVLSDGSLLGAQHQAGLGGQSAGVQIRPGDYGVTCGMTHRIRVTVPCSDSQAEALVAFARAQIGKPYDTLAIEAFVADRDWRDPKAWFCSELAVAALEAAGIVARLPFTPANKVSPNTALAICQAVGGVAVALDPIG